MKKIFALLSIASLLIVSACGGDDKTPEQDTGTITIANDQLNQTIEASATSTSITFSTEEAWSAAFESAADWMSLDPELGASGSHKINVKVDVNYAKTPRSAMVIIKSGTSEAIVTITQKAAAGGGSSKNISKITYAADKNGNTMTLNFAYDSKNRLIKIDRVATEEEDDSEISFSYSGSSVTATMKYMEDGDSYSETATVILGSNGYVISGSAEGTVGYIYFSSWTASYDNGYLKQRSTIHEDDEEGYDSETIIDCTWEGGNMTGVKYTYKDDPLQYGGTATYGTIANDTNLDLNTFIYEDEWFGMIDDYHFINIGLYGKRSANLVSTVVADRGDAGAGTDTYTYAYGEDSNGNVVEVLSDGVTLLTIDYL